MYKWNKQMIKDLLDQSSKTRATGRSDMMADCYIELAKENPNQYLIIRDHYPHRQADELLLQLIGYKINEINEEFIRQNFRVRFSIKEGKLIFLNNPEYASIIVTNERKTK